VKLGHYSIGIYSIFILTIIFLVWNISENSAYAIGLQIHMTPGASLGGCENTYTCYDIVHYEIAPRTVLGPFIPFIPVCERGDTTPPPAPILQQPADNSATTDTTPTFDWSDVTDPCMPVTYTLLVDDDPTFSSPEIDVSGLISSSYTPPSPLAVEDYYWKVTAYDNNNNVSPDSSVFAVTISVAPPPPPDFDNDGIPDATDNCVLISNPDQKNTDGDAQGDACDNDDDNDGVVDSLDTCPLQPETFNGYQDTDGCPDTPPSASSTTPPSTAQPATGDFDNDTIPDTSDNCVLISNLDQKNTDGDAQGDACDDDDDNDGVNDSLDKCPIEPETFNGYNDQDGCPDTAPTTTQPPPTTTQPPPTTTQPPPTTTQPPPTTTQPPPTTTQPPPTTSTTALETEVSIRPGSITQGCEVDNSCYSQSTLNVNTGQKITWHNDDSRPHTIVSGTPEEGKDGIFESSLIKEGETFSYTFSEEGTFQYFDVISPWMQGTIIVTGAPPTSSPTSPQEDDTTSETTPSGGCLIATATFGTELASQVQQLRELRDNTLLQTNSGSVFMGGFNLFYYSFSPTIADWERQSSIFKELVKITITPMISTLSILNYVEIDSEEDMLGYGLSLIMLNLGIYFVAPIIGIMKLKQFLGNRK